MNSRQMFRKAIVRAEDLLIQAQSGKISADRADSAAAALQSPPDGISPAGAHACAVAIAALHRAKFAKLDQAEVGELIDGLMRAADDLRKIDAEAEHAEDVRRGRVSAYFSLS